MKTNSIQHVPNLNSDYTASGSMSVQFPISFELGNKSHHFRVWDGQQLPDQLLAFDTETTVCDTEEIPQLALATVCGDMGSCYFIHPHDLPRFIQQHHKAFWCCHNAAFDFWVTARALANHPEALSDWWGIAGDNRLVCTMLFDSLLQLAKNDADPINRDLATVAAENCGLRLDKEDPYRLRYAELIGLPITAWPETEAGFWTYAAVDSVATLQVAQKQFPIALALIEPFREELLPDALRRFGPLSVCLQVQGAIALDYISRNGCSIDIGHANTLRAEVANLVEHHAKEMEVLLPGAFKRFGSRAKLVGQLQRTSTGVPRRNANAIKKKLEQIANNCEKPIKPRRLKTGLVTDAVAYWAQHRDVHPFLNTFVDYSQQAKLAQFFRGLQTDRIRPRYRPLVRSGRTSCSRPNLQQLPRDGRFREMIVAPPGFFLLQIDYAVLELRTLAQICLRRYGQSRLATLFKEGCDPHRYTAALLLGIDLHKYAELPPVEQSQHRQRAKAINFGVPGGLGAAALVDYAKNSYGVQLTVQQAREFRRRLIHEIYPELAAYLRDNQHQAIADNLKTSLVLVQQALPQHDQIRSAALIINGSDRTPAGEKFATELIDHVWLVMQQLNRNADLAPDLAAKRPGNLLMRRCFYGSACTLSGRLRGHVNFSQAANTPFQGLAADGNKLALFRLVRAGFPVCGFIHDEMLVLVPAGCDYTVAVQKIEEILLDSMQQFCTDIPIGCSYLLADRWYKNAPKQPRDADGRIVPYCRQTELMALGVNAPNISGTGNFDPSGASR